ncbi:MAG: VOC family protein [Candidatus Dormibacteraeota bacterium]|nr:VOC family protein [Candidatus Dormibacteraeota bacterium]
MATPTYRTGKICYLEIPTTDVKASVNFYTRVFGWQTRQRGDGSTAFDDTVNEVSGTWVLGRPPTTELGLIVYVMVADAKAAVDAIRAAGGQIVKPVDASSREIFAVFRDPAGNVMGIYQQPGLREQESRQT